MCDVNRLSWQVFGQNGFNYYWIFVLLIIRSYENSLGGKLPDYNLSKSGISITRDQNQRIEERSESSSPHLLYLHISFSKSRIVANIAALSMFALGSSFRFQVSLMAAILCLTEPISFWFWSTIVYCLLITFPFVTIVT